MDTAPRRAAVLGKPIAHSLSPVLHNTAYARLGLAGWRYDAHECDEGGLAAFVAGLNASWVGLSLTMPLKRVALDVADEVSPRAAAIGAGNTLLLRGERRLLDNTDAPGMVDALREGGVGAVKAAVVIGAGGTAQAALAALAELTGEPVAVMVRDPARTAELRATAERLGVTLDVRSLNDADAVLDGADLVVSTTPWGAADGLAGLVFEMLGPGRVLFDVVYDPWPTPVAAAALAAGARVVSGLDLLLHQAGHQVRLMTGREAPLAAMRSAVAAARR